MDKKYDLTVDIIENDYVFMLDYGTQDSSICTISEDDVVAINYGRSYLIEENEMKFRKEDLINEVLNPLFGNESEMIINEEVIKVPFAFKKVKEYVINNNLSVSNDYNLDDEFNLNRTYQYRSVYDEGLDSVSFYVKSNLFDDEIGIIIYSDDTFTPVISTKHINLTSLAKNQRLEMLKKFIYELLSVKISFGTVDGIHGLRVKNISSKAIKQAKMNATIEYTDDNGDIYVYKDTTTINGMGSV